MSVDSVRSLTTHLYTPKAREHPLVVPRAQGPEGKRVGGVWGIINRSENRLGGGGDLSEEDEEEDSQKEKKQISRIINNKKET